MYLITIHAATTNKNPDHGKIGEAHVNCWIERETLDLALKVAQDLVVEDGWEILETGEVSIVKSSDFDNDEELASYYEQALIDKEVLVFHICPRFPVYYMLFNVVAPSEEKDVQARVWISNECVEDGHDPMDLEFWSGSRVEKAVALVKQAIAEQGFEAGELVDQERCSGDSDSQDAQFFNDAEEHGICLSFVHAAD